MLITVGDWVVWINGIIRVVFSLLRLTPVISFEPQLDAKSQSGQNLAQRYPKKVGVRRKKREDRMK